MYQFNSKWILSFGHHVIRGVFSYLIKQQSMELTCSSIVYETRYGRGSWTGGSFSVVAQQPQHRCRPLHARPDTNNCATRLTDPIHCDSTRFHPHWQHNPPLLHFTPPQLYQHRHNQYPQIPIPSQGSYSQNKRKNSRSPHPLFHLCLRVYIQRAETLIDQASLIPFVWTPPDV